MLLLLFTDIGKNYIQIHVKNPGPATIYFSQVKRVVMKRQGHSSNVSDIIRSKSLMKW